MRAAIYVRVSRDPRGQARSVAEQEAECRTWADREGWTVDGVWCDNHISASRYARKARPGWQALTDRLGRGGIDVLVVWEPSRATRDRRVWAALAATCEEQGTRFGCNGRVYDLADPEDAFQLDLYFALATRESGTTRKRVNRAVRANAASGRPHGKILYGYRRVYDPQTGAMVEQVPDETHAAVVREAARRVLSGETPYAIAQDLNRRGIPAPRGAERGWDLTQVRRMCVNPGYVGQRVHRGKVVGAASWPPILDEHAHAALLAHFADPRRRSTRDQAIKHLLSGVAVCGVCGGRIRSRKVRGYRSYVCVDGFCVGRRQPAVDDLVQRVVVGRLSRPDVVDLLAEEQPDHVREALDAAQGLRGRLDGFYDAAAAGDLTPAALGRIEATLLPQIADAERRAQRSARSPLLAEVAGPDAAQRWAQLSMPQQREVIRLLMTVRLMPTGVGRRVLHPETVKIEWKGTP